MKHLSILFTMLAAFAFTQVAFGQASVELQVVGSAGNVVTSTSGATLHYTAGEMATREEVNGATLAQGFHQILVQKVSPTTESVTLAANIRVYPNPAQDFLRLETDTPLRASLFDLSGRQVLPSTAVETTTELDLSALPVGTYLLQSLTAEGNPLQSFKIQIIR